MEYLIQENTLTQIADTLRNKLKYKDLITSLIGDKSRIISVEIPENITTIGSYIFSYCQNLISITLPSSLSEIGYSAFYECTNLANIYLYSITPPILNSINAISTYTTAIHVPIGSGELYKSATNWSNFANIIIEDIEIN